MINIQLVSLAFMCTSFHACGKYFSYSQESICKMPYPVQEKCNPSILNDAFSVLSNFVFTTFYHIFAIYFQGVALCATK